MNENTNKIKEFTDLDAWKEAHKLVLMVYKQTNQFPKEEVFGLVSQMRRCSVSITSNIAEGFSRPSYKEKVRFYFVSLGSVTELQNQLLISKDISFIDVEDFKNIMDLSIKVHKIINGLIKKSKLLINS
jgi:four helix bundle protein